MRFSKLELEWRTRSKRHTAKASCCTKWQPGAKRSAETRPESSPSSQAPLLGPGPLRTGRETFVLIRLKPCERLVEGDAASIRKGADGEPCRGTLDEVERGCPLSSNHPAQEGRNGEGASP